MPRLRFSIRDLLWLMLAIGLVLAWWVDRTRLVEYGREQQQRADKEVAWSQMVRDRIITDQQKEINRLMSSRP